MGKNKGMGRKVEAREPLLILQVRVLGLVVVKRAFVVKAKLLSGQWASNWKAGKYNLKALYFYLPQSEGLSSKYHIATNAG